MGDVQTEEDMKTLVLSGVKGVTGVGLLLDTNTSLPEKWSIPSPL